MVFYLVYVLIQLTVSVNGVPRFEMECEATGNPVPTLQWLLNGEQVREADGI